MKNLLTDVAGVSVGHAQDAAIGSGTTVILFDKPAVAAMDVRGGGPGIHDAVLVDLVNTVESIDAFVLSGGSAYGLQAGGGVQAYLAEQGRGFRIREAVVPLVTGAVVFDLLNGGNKAWGRFPPYRDLGYAAAASASNDGFALGSVGAGLGATTATLKGGLGSASAKTASGVTVAALAVVNAVGSVTVGDGPSFWAAPFEVGKEFGGCGLPSHFDAEALRVRLKGISAAPGENTTIAAIVTDAKLDKAQTKRLAIIAHTGFARAIYPVHAPLDGDAVFAAATGVKSVEPLAGLTELGATAANVLSRAIARGVYEATALPFAGALPSWRDRFGGAKT